MKGAALALFAATLFAIPSAHALSVIPPTFEVLVSEAETVIDGEVTGVRSELKDYQGRPIVYTYVTIHVLDTLKGSATDTVELRILGGTVGDVTVEIPGVPKFKAGERDLFFIHGNGSAFCPLVSVPHGYYPIEKRPTDGADVVLRSNGAPLAAPSEVVQELHELAPTERGKAAASRAMTLSEFKKQIRAEVAHAREQ